MKRIIYQLACYLLITAFVPAAFCQTSSDVWDISQGGTIISTTSIIGLSDARDMFGGNFGSSGDTTTVFQEQEIGPTDYAHTVEWQSPNLITVSNFNLYLSSDTDGMRAIGSLAGLLGTVVAINLFSHRTMFLFTLEERSYRELLHLLPPVVGKPNLHSWKLGILMDRGSVNWMDLAPLFRHSMWVAMVRMEF